jgi:hypothetical protein
MLQILYIVAFTALSLLAVVNLVKSMISLAQTESKPPRYPSLRRSYQAVHPELVDDDGNITDEPLMVMRSISFDDARSRLDAIYNSSPSSDS